MKALPLWQPWAQLVAIGAKRIETRHWPAPASMIGERIAIHATLTKSELWRCGEEPFSRYVPDMSALPLGAIVATCVIDRCTPMTQDGIAKLRDINADEFAFGHYALGRFAMVLRDVERLPAPIPFKGQQGKFFDVPDDLLGYAPAPRRYEQETLL